MTPGPVQIEWSGDAHLRVSFGSDRSDSTHRRVMAALEAIRRAGIVGVLDLVPAYSTLLVSLRGNEQDPVRVRRAVTEAAERSADTPERHDSRVVHVPVCYESAFAPDIDALARSVGRSVDEIAAEHSGPEYRVRFLGFAPGFAYLAGLPEALRMARLDRPRTRVPAGSVAIADDQTGIYPRATPGGWRIIGRTPLTMFDAERIPPSLLSAGDRVRFVPIDAGRFESISQGSG